MIKGKELKVLKRLKISKQNRDLLRKFSDSCTVNFPVIMPIDHNKTFVTSKEVFYSEDCKTK